MRIASSPNTMHCEPNWSAPCRMRSGFSTAAVLMETLSAPASSMVCMSFTERSPPPTARGMKTCSATCETTSSMMERPSADAVMS